MKYLSGVALALSGLVFSGCSLAGTGGGFVPKYSDTLLNFVEVDGKQWPYRLYVPSAYDRLDKDTRWPLVLGLHGAGGDENSYYSHKSCANPIYEVAEKRGYIFAGCCGPRQDNSLLAEAPLEVMKEVQKHWHIDPSRIYVTGFSKGALTTYQLLAEHPEPFAAAFPLVWPPISNDAKLKDSYKIDMKIYPPEEKAKQLAKVPMKIFVGTRDKHTPIENVQKDVDMIRAAGGEVDLYIHEGGHGGYRLNWAYEMIFDWFDQHVKPLEEAPAGPKEQHEN
jgi:predicted peptidase